MGALGEPRETTRGPPTWAPHLKATAGSSQQHAGAVFTGLGLFWVLRELHIHVELPGPCGESEACLALRWRPRPDPPADLTPRAVFGSMLNEQLAGLDWDSRGALWPGAVRPRTGSPCVLRGSRCLGHRGSGACISGLAPPSPNPSSEAVGPRSCAALASTQPGAHQLLPGPF